MHRASLKDLIGTLKGNRIFQLVKDDISYSFYYNTRYGALGTPCKNRSGNCVDITHLLVALSKGLQGYRRGYVHAACTFISGTPMDTSGPSSM